MSFPRAKSKRFNEITGCAPPVGSYDPLQFDASIGPVSFDKAGRFATPLKDCNNGASSADISYQSLNPGNNNRIHTRNVNCCGHEMKIRDLEKQVRQFIQECNKLDKQINIKDEDFKKLNNKYQNLLIERNGLQASIASIEKQLRESTKGHDILEEKVTILEGSCRQKESLKIDLAQMKGQLISKQYELNDVQANLTTALNSLVKKDKELTVLKADLEGVHLKMESLEESKKIIENGQTDMKDHVEELENEIEQLHLLTNQVQYDKDSLEEQLLHLTKESNCVKKDFELEIAEAKAKIIDLSANLQEQHEIALKKQTELEEALKEKEKVTDLWVNLQQQYEIALNKQTELEDVMKIITNKLQMLTNLEEVKSANLQIKALNINLEEERQAVFEAKAEIALLKEHVEQNEQINKELADNLDSVTEKRSDLQKELETCLNTLKKQEVIINELEKNHKQIQLEYNLKEVVITDLLNKNNNQNQDMVKMSSEIKILTDNLEATQTNKKQAEDLIEKLQQQTSFQDQKHTQMSLELADQNELIANLRNQNNNQNQHIVKISAEIKLLTEDLNASHTSKKQVEDLIEKLQQQTSFQDKNLTQMTLELANQNELIADLRNQNQDLVKMSAEIKILTEDLEVMHKNKKQGGDLIEKLLQQTNSQDQTLTQMSLELTDQNKLIADLRNQSNNQNQDMIKMSTEIKVLTADLEAAHTNKKQTKDLIEKLQQQTSSQDQKFIQISLELTDQNELVVDLRNQNNNQNQDLVKLSAEIKILTEDLEAMHTNKKQAEDLIAKLQQQTSYQDQKLTQMTLELDDQNKLQLMTEELQQKYSNQNQMLLELTSINKQLLHKLDIVHSNENKLQKETEELHHKNKIQESALLEQETKIEELQEKCKESTNTSSNLELRLQRTYEELDSILNTCKDQQTMLKQLEFDKSDLQEHLITAYKDINRYKTDYLELSAREVQLVKELEEGDKHNKLAKEELTRRLVETQKHLSLIEVEFLNYREGTAKQVELVQKHMDQEQQYKEQLEELEEKIVEQYIIEEYKAEIDKWRTLYEDLEERIEPFKEQLDAFEADKQALLSQNSQAMSEVKKLSQQYAKLLGHQNHKQKIHHILNIKEENINLKQEIAKLRTQSKKDKSSILKLEDNLRACLGVKRFDPSKAFKNDKENSDPS